jgi:hypothetical protein
MTSSLKLFGVRATAVAFAALAISSAAVAQDQSNVDPLDLTIANVTVTQVGVVERPQVINVSNSLNTAGELAEVEAELGTLEVIFDKVINLGQKIWNLAEAGRPVVNMRGATANALPEGVQTWTQMSGWQNPRSAIYRVNYQNVYGVTVVDFTFRVNFTAGGNVGGKGQYLSRVSVEPVNLLVRWGFNFDAAAEVANVVNVGTMSSPVAGMEIMLRWKTSTVMNAIESTASYFVRGDGQMLDLNRTN